MQDLNSTSKSVESVGLVREDFGDGGAIGETSSDIELEASASQNLEKIIREFGTSDGSYSDSDIESLKFSNFQISEEGLPTCEADVGFHGMVRQSSLEGRLAESTQSAYVQLSEENQLLHDILDQVTRKLTEEDLFEITASDKELIERIIEGGSQDSLKEEISQLNNYKCGLPFIFGEDAEKDDTPGNSIHGGKNLSSLEALHTHLERPGFTSDKMFLLNLNEKKHLSIQSASNILEIVKDDPNYEVVDQSTFINFQVNELPNDSYTRKHDDAVKGQNQSVVKAENISNATSKICVPVNTDASVNIKTQTFDEMSDNGLKFNFSANMSNENEFNHSEVKNILELVVGDIENISEYQSASEVEPADQVTVKLKDHVRDVSNSNIRSLLEIKESEQITKEINSCDCDTKAIQNDTVVINADNQSPAAKQHDETESKNVDTLAEMHRSNHLNRPKPTEIRIHLWTGFSNDYQNSSEASKTLPFIYGSDDVNRQNIGNSQNEQLSPFNMFTVNNAITLAILKATSNSQKTEAVHSVSKEEQVSSANQIHHLTNPQDNFSSDQEIANDSSDNKWNFSTNQDDLPVKSETRETVGGNHLTQEEDFRIESEGSSNNESPESIESCEQVSSPKERKNISIKIYKNVEKHETPPSLPSNIAVYANELHSDSKHLSLEIQNMPHVTQEESSQLTPSNEGIFANKEHFCESEEDNALIKSSIDETVTSKEDYAHDANQLSLKDSHEDQKALMTEEKNVAVQEETPIFYVASSNAHECKNVLDTQKILALKSEISYPDQQVSSKHENTTDKQQNIPNEIVSEEQNAAALEKKIKEYGVEEVFLTKEKNSQDEQIYPINAKVSLTEPSVSDNTQNNLSSKRKIAQDEDKIYSDEQENSLYETVRTYHEQDIHYIGQNITIAEHQILLSQANKNTAKTTPPKQENTPPSQESPSAGSDIAVLKEENASDERLNLSCKMFVLSEQQMSSDEENKSLPQQEIDLPRYLPIVKASNDDEIPLDDNQAIYSHEQIKNTIKPLKTMKKENSAEKTTDFTEAKNSSDEPEKVLAEQNHIYDQLSNFFAKQKSNLGQSSLPKRSIVSSLMELFASFENNSLNSQKVENISVSETSASIERKIGSDEKECYPDEVQSFSSEKLFSDHVRQTKEPESTTKVKNYGYRRTGCSEEIITYTAPEKISDHHKDLWSGETKITPTEHAVICTEPAQHLLNGVSEEKRDKLLADRQLFSVKQEMNQTDLGKPSVQLQLSLNELCMLLTEQNNIANKTRSISVENEKFSSEKKILSFEQKTTANVDKLSLLEREDPPSIQEISSDKLEVNKQNTSIAVSPCITLYQDEITPSPESYEHEMHYEKQVISTFTDLTEDEISLADTVRSEKQAILKQQDIFLSEHDFNLKAQENIFRDQVLPQTKKENCLEHNISTEKPETNPTHQVEANGEHENDLSQLFHTSELESVIENVNPTIESGNLREDIFMNQVIPTIKAEHTLVEKESTAIKPENSFIGAGICVEQNKYHSVEEVKIDKYRTAEQVITSPMQEEAVKEETILTTQKICVDLSPEHTLTSLEHQVISLNEQETFTSKHEIAAENSLETISSKDQHSVAPKFSYEDFGPSVYQEALSSETQHKSVIQETTCSKPVNLHDVNLIPETGELLECKQRTPPIKNDIQSAVYQIISSLSDSPLDKPRMLSIMEDIYSVKCAIDRQATISSVKQTVLAAEQNISEMKYCLSSLNQETSLIKDNYGSDEVDITLPTKNCSSNICVSERNSAHSEERTSEGEKENFAKMQNDVYQPKQDIIQYAQALSEQIILQSEQGILEAEEVYFEQVAFKPEKDPDQTEKDISFEANATSSIKVDIPSLEEPKWNIPLVTEVICTAKQDAASIQGDSRSPKPIPPSINYQSDDGSKQRVVSSPSPKSVPSVCLNNPGELFSPCAPHEPNLIDADISSSRNATKMRGLRMTVNILDEDLREMQPLLLDILNDDKPVGSPLTDSSDAVDTQPDFDRKAFHSRVKRFLKEKDFQSMLDECYRASLTNPKYPDAYAYMGLANALLNRLEYAAYCYRKAMKLRPRELSYGASLRNVEKMISLRDVIKSVEEFSVKLPDQKEPSREAFLRELAMQSDDLKPQGDHVL